MKNLLLHTQTVNRRYGAIAAAILLPLLGWQGVKAWQYQSAGWVPDSVKTCLPIQADRTELWGTVQREADSYYLIRVKQGNRDWETLVSVNPQNACQVVYPTDPNSLELQYSSQFLPIEAARQLALQKFSREIDRQGSREKFAESFRYDIRNAEFITYLPPEEAWALEQLQIPIPRGVQVLP